MAAAGIEFDTAFTRYRGHASELAATIAESTQGTERLLVFGGDGTLNEVINGLIRNDENKAPELELLFIPAGSSCDFEKLIMKHEDYVERVRSTDVIPIDIGKVSCNKEDGSPAVRYFINNSSIGIISEANEVFNSARGLTRRIKQFSVDAGAILAGLDAIRHFQDLSAVCSSPSLPEQNLKISNVTVFKNPYFGGGMNYGVDPGRQSGNFGIAIVGPLSKPGLLALIPALYMGRITRRSDVSYFEDRAFSITPGRKSEVETDGETAGSGPARYEVIPQCIKVVI